MDELDNSTSRPRRRLNRIETNSDPVQMRGEALDEVWWRGKQWAVTAFGIECLDGTYHVAADRLTHDPEHPWPLHMASKKWVDIDEFVTAWMVALLLHQRAGRVDPVAVRELFGRLPPVGLEDTDE